MIILVSTNKMMSLVFDGILLLPKQSLNLKDIENYL